MSVETEMETQPSTNPADQSESAAETAAPPPQRRRRARPLLIGGIAFVLLAVGLGTGRRVFR